MGKKQKIVWIVLFSLLGLITLCSLIGLRFLIEFKYALFGLVIAWGIILTVFQIIRLGEYKKSLDEDMPLYLAELLNAGIITKEQALNPGKKEKEMFLGEYMSAIRKKRFFIVLTSFFAVYGATLFFWL